jgi:cysteine desulfurase family protein (TIGR01976 family)
MDNAGGSVPARPVVELATEHLQRYMVQLGASYPRSVEAQARVEAGRKAAARLLGAEPDEVYLGASSTANVRILARALRPLWEEGDEVIITQLDHETNRGAWRALEATGIRVREWPLRPETASLEWEDLEPLLTSRTRLVAFTHCANVVGGIHDAAALCDRIRQAGALSVVDGVAYAPHRQVDVRQLGADFYFLSLYKVYGPHLGVLYGRRQLLRRAKGQNHFFVGEDEVPYKYEPGNVPYELMAALPGILRYLDALDRHTFPDATHTSPSSGLRRAFDAIAAHEEQLVRPLIHFLRDRPGVHLLGPRRALRQQRVPTVCFHVEGRDSAEIPPLLEKHRIAIRYGHFYAPRAIEALGLEARNGIVRISLVHYNTAAEVERLLEALETVL